VYDSYAKVPGITMVGCMAHAHRKFFDAKVADKILAEQALTLLGAVYAVEKISGKKASQVKINWRSDKSMRYPHSLHYTNG
jgi:hypothetical protein